MEPNVTDPEGRPKFYLKLYCKQCDMKLAHAANGGENVMSDALETLLAMHRHDTNNMEMWEALYRKKL